MHALCTLTFVVLLTLVTTSAQAEGLIHQLPEDGAWAQFDMEGKGTEPNGIMVTLSGTITISSVGTTEVDGERCRWIEIPSSRWMQRGPPVLGSTFRVQVHHHANRCDPDTQ